MLFAIKIAFGIIGQSSALIADGIHSLSDLLSDGFVFIAIKLGSRKADQDHPYGHARFETISTALLGGSLILVASGICWDAIDRIRHPEWLLVPDHWTLAIALVSILANEWLYHYTRYIANSTRSKLLLANAWHHRSDALSSIVVLFGIGAVLGGYPLADSIASIVVGLMIIKIGIQLILDSLKELVDTSLPLETVTNMRHNIIAVDGVRDVHLLRTRQMGENTFADVHIVVDPKISVSEGHRIADSVRDKLIAGFDHVVDVLVHTDPEDDEYSQSQRLPTRASLLKTLDFYWGNLSPLFLEINIHYLSGHVELEIVLPKTLAINEPKKIEIIRQKLTQIEKELQIISKVSLLIAE